MSHRYTFYFLVLYYAFGALLRPNKKALKRGFFILKKLGWMLLINKSKLLQ
ncbi:hypothetical protein JOC76_002979 [Neobacillus cucumis]|nr:hypothetical protein [Neobacillus cucumis]